MSVTDVNSKEAVTHFRVLERLDNVTLEINLSVAASEHNADSVKNNTYIWEYGKNAIGNKNFYLKIKIGGWQSRPPML